jgi:hypothetical protein
LLAALRLGVVGHRSERTCGPSGTPFPPSRAFPFHRRPRRDFLSRGTDSAEDFQRLVSVDAFGSTSKRAAAAVAAARSADERQIPPVGMPSSVALNRDVRLTGFPLLLSTSVAHFVSLYCSALGSWGKGGMRLRVRARGSCPYRTVKQKPVPAPAAERRASSSRISFPYGALVYAPAVTSRPGSVRSIAPRRLIINAAVNSACLPTAPTAMCSSNASCRAKPFSDGRR